jgi:hypothetical protein
VSASTLADCTALVAGDDVRESFGTEDDPATIEIASAANLLSACDVVADEAAELDAEPLKCGCCSLRSCKAITASTKLSAFGKSSPVDTRTHNQPTNQPIIQRGTLNGSFITTICLQQLFISASSSNIKIRKMKWNGEACSLGNSTGQFTI